MAAADGAHCYARAGGARAGRGGGHGQAGGDPRGARDARHCARLLGAHASTRRARPGGAGAYWSAFHRVQGDVLALPFPEATFDCATIGFGLRNLADLREFRLASPGGLLAATARVPDTGERSSAVVMPWRAGPSPAVRGHPWSATPPRPAGVGGLEWATAASCIAIHWGVAGSAFVAASLVPTSSWWSWAVNVTLPHLGEWVSGDPIALHEVTTLAASRREATRLKTPSNYLPTDRRPVSVGSCQNAALPEITIKSLRRAAHGQFKPCGRRRFTQLGAANQLCNLHRFSADGSITPTPSPSTVPAMGS